MKLDEPVVIENEGGESGHKNFARKKKLCIDGMVFVKLSTCRYVFEERSDDWYERGNITSTFFNHVGEPHEESIKDKCLPMNGSKNLDENKWVPQFPILRWSQS